MKQRTLERDLLSPKYRQRVEASKKGKGSYKRTKVGKNELNKYSKVVYLAA